MAQLGVLRVRQIEAVGDQRVQNFLGEAMNRKRVALAGESGFGLLATDDREGGHGGEEKCFKVIAADDHHGVGFDFIQVLAELAHGGDVGVELRFVLAGRIGE